MYLKCGLSTGSGSIAILMPNVFDYFNLNFSKFLQVSPGINSSSSGISSVAV